MSFDFQRLLVKLQFRTTERIKFFEKMAMFVDQGIDVYSAIALLAERASATKDSRAVIYADIARSIENGNDFSEALENWVDDEERMLIASGEKSDNPSTGIKLAVELSQKRAQMTTAVQSELTMPALLMLFLFGILLFFSFNIAPQIEASLPRKYWPDRLQNIGLVSDITKAWWWAILGCVSAASALFATSLGRWVSPLRDTLDKLPPYAVYREFRAATFLMALSALLRSGIDLNQSMENVKTRSVRWLSRHISRMQNRLASGHEPGHALDTGLFDRELANDIKDFGRGDRFNSAIDFLGKTAADRGATRIRRFAAGVRFLIMAVMALSVIYGYSAIYDLQTAAKAQSQAAQKVVERN
jgi:type II secretory pathway component PulF